MSITAPPAVEVTGLVVRYGMVVAVDGVDLYADPGEVVAVLGRNGAGKTSTIEAIEGYRRAVAGIVRVVGLDPQRADGRRALSRRIGVMLQQGGVYPAMGPAEALHLFASYYPNPEDPDALLRRLGLVGATARTPWRRLSGGEQQRLSLALALIGRPEVVFLDEPTAGVDPHGRQIIRAVVAELRARGACVLLTTHELDEAERMADRVVIIDRGRVLAAGTPGQLTASDRPDEPPDRPDEPPGRPGQPPGRPGQPPDRPGQPPDRPDEPPRRPGEPPVRPSGRPAPTAPTPEIRFAAPPGLDTAALGARLGVQVCEETPGEYRVAAPGAPATVAELAAWLAEHDVPLLDLRAGRHRLEDVFLRLTSGDTGAPGDKP
jgi:ABC-2 type transport system ATP-binding protein